MRVKRGWAAVVALGLPWLAGCGGSSPSSPSAEPPCPASELRLQAGRSEGRVESAGACRAYVVHVPDSYRSDRPVPLVLAMHGHGGNPAEFEVASDLTSASEANGFVVAYPAGLRGEWRTDAAGDDVRFLRDLVARLSARAAIDPRRVYLTGFSGGGGMAHRAACQAADVFAAAAPVSAALQDYRRCAPARPVPILAIHGAADPLVLPEGGNGGWPPVLEWTSFWARLDRCEAAPTVTPRFMMTETAWRRCAAGSEVRLLMIDGLEHRWWAPVNVELWSFLSSHSLSG